MYPNAPFQLPNLLRHGGSVACIANGRIFAYPLSMTVYSDEIHDKTRKADGHNLV
jgi:hypothetical protein